MVQLSVLGSKEVRTELENVREAGEEQIFSLGFKASTSAGTVGKSKLFPSYNFYYYFLNSSGSEKESSETTFCRIQTYFPSARQHTRKILDREEQLFWYSMPHIQNWKNQ